MNDHMWAHPQTQRNVAHLRELGYLVLDPDEGMLAAGEGSGPGRMPEPETIFAHVGRVLERRDAGALDGKRVLVTAGPTRESIDPVRFISNHSSGKMGVALAAAAWRRGAAVDLVAGPLERRRSGGRAIGARCDDREDGGRGRAAAAEADVLVMAAAPADFRPAEPATQKIKKTDAPPTLALAPTPDILAGDARSAPRRSRSSSASRSRRTTPLASGRKKLAAKDLDMIVVNDATEPGAGFGVDTNRVTLLTRDGDDEHFR